MDPSRWQTLTISQQLGNVASEFARFRYWFKRGEDAHTDQAFDRLIELATLTRDDPRWVARRHELGLLVEVIRHFHGERPELEVSFDDVEAYLLPFALRARRNHASSIG